MSKYTQIHKHTHTNMYTSQWFIHAITENHTYCVVLVKTDYVISLTKGPVIGSPCLTIHPGGLWLESYGCIQGNSHMIENVFHCFV